MLATPTSIRISTLFILHSGMSASRGLPAILNNFPISCSGCSDPPDPAFTGKLVQSSLDCANCFSHNPCHFFP